MSALKQYLLYAHGGACNHGSEASVKCDIELLRNISPGCKIILSSHFPEQDIKFGIHADEIIGRRSDASAYAEMYKETIERITPETICLCVGGDVYCYRNWQRYAYIHNAAKEIGAKSILWSCSLEPDMIDAEMLETLRTHDLITVRESVTASALEKHGIKKYIQVSDIAFRLIPEKTGLPDGKYVVLNLSPLVIRKNPNVFRAYQMLVDNILENTDLNIAMVPHVEVNVDNDTEALNRLHGDDARIFRIPGGLSAAQYKYIIGHAELCVASRTHATIAAWSQYVPSIAVGYSSKAVGISCDLGQGKYLIENDCITGDAICRIFFDLFENKERIRSDLQNIIPYFISNAVPDAIKSYL